MINERSIINENINDEKTQMKYLCQFHNSCHIIDKGLLCANCFSGMTLKFLFYFYSELYRRKSMPHLLQINYFELLF